MRCDRIWLSVYIESKPMSIPSSKLRPGRYMALHRTKKGLELPISGAPAQTVSEAAQVTRVALLARDYVGLRARLLVQPDDRVRVGQPLFEDRKSKVSFVSPAAGIVEAVHRGERRALMSVVIRIEGEQEAIRFEAHSPGCDATREGVQALLRESGLWTALRTRPFSRAPRPGSAPSSIFVTAVDTHPLAARPEVVLAGREEVFQRGLRVLEVLTDGPVFLCRAPGAPIEPGRSRARVEEFTGKHPAGTAGYHIHVLDPVHRDKEVWHIGYQDVVRIGHLFQTGELDTSTIISLGGPLVERPRLVRTRLGACMAELVAGELRGGPERPRVVSGSVLHGDRAMGDELGFLGRFHNQVTVLAEGGKREFLGWLTPGARRFSVIPTFLSSLLPTKRFDFNTSMYGSRRAMVPIGLYERVMPMDLMPTHLLRALTVGDPEWGEELGVLELDEEDLSLCTFVCPGKVEYGPALRRMLTTLEEEG